MLARPDSSAIPGRSAASAAAFPAWARAVHAPETAAEAGFLAGAALARLDAIVRENPPWAGAWRQRLALAAAAASVRRAGRSEDEAALRDALHLTRSGADPGPAGRRLLAWRALAAGSAGQWRSAIAVAADALDLPGDDALQAAIEAAEACAAGHRPAPFAAASDVGARAAAPSAPATAAGQGNCSRLARRCRARPKTEMAVRAAAARRAAVRGRGPARDDRMPATAPRRPASCSPGPRAPRTPAISPPSSGGGRKSSAEAAPKLRAKGAKAALQALLDQDSLAAATPIAGLSERGTRRLFERLVALGAIRELTGRATFRLYGL